MDLAQVAAVVTGGGSGLGQATARALAKQDVKVAVFDVNVEAGERVAREVGGLFCQVDVTDDASVDDAFAHARAAHGQERILVNCAGTGNGIKTVSRSSTDGAIRQFPITEFDRIIQINLVGTFRCTVKSAAGMLTLDPAEDGERGAIINTASIAAEDGQVGQAAYAASKGGVVSLTLPIARDLMAEGIRVNTILPGIFDTPLMMSVPEKVKSALASGIPFPRRFGAPAEFASLVLEICRNSYFNGEDIRLDGALRMGLR
jgi:NAD(P)-dependent dehydrogenase (short-subunit alcohol dehydrogenase family)